MHWIEAWAMAFGAVLLAGLGCLALARGLAGRWFLVRRNRGCWRCRYDMSEVAGDRCPECGHVASDPAEHFAGRRRLWLAGLGLVFLLGSVGLGQYRVLRSGSLWTVVPRSVQIRMWDGAPGELHDHVYGLVRNSELSESQLAQLADRVMLRVTDPNLTQNDLGPAVDLIQSPGQRLFDEAALLKIIETGRASAVAAAIREAVARGVPETEAMRKWRRREANSREYERRNLMFLWLALDPAGPADDAIISGALQANQWSYSRAFSNAIRGGDPRALAFVESLLSSQDPRVVRGAFRLLQTTMVSQVQVPDSFVELLGDLARHADPGVRSEAIRVLAQVNSGLVEVFERFIEEEREPAVILEALSGLTLSNRLPPELIPVLERCALDMDQPVSVRLAAARTLQRLRVGPAARDAKLSMAPELIDQYEAVWEEVISGSDLAEIAAEQQFGFGSGLAAFALARQIPERVSGREALGDWFRDHPGVGRIVSRWGTAVGDPVEQFGSVLRRVLREFADHPALAGEAQGYLVRLLR